MTRAHDPQFEDVRDVERRATDAQYDERGNIIANSSVPPPDPNYQPEVGDIATSPEQLNASAPPPPETPDPCGGSVSASRANPNLPNERKKELRSADGKGTRVFATDEEKHEE